MQWKEINLIVESLEENYSDIDIEDLENTELYDLILDLSEFSDDPENCDNERLQKIKESWIEFRRENN